MPLIKEWNPDIYSLAAIWKIEEPEEFFIQDISEDLNIKHAKRRIERLAGRFLLKYVQNDFPVHSIIIDEHDKPQLPGFQYHFSISHSYPYAAVVISSDRAVGIDIQCWHSNIIKIQEKFLSQAEQAFCKGIPEWITLAWCAKEAAYKWLGRRGIDFIKHLPISSLRQNKGIFEIVINQEVNSEQEPIYTQGVIEQHFALCVVVYEK